MNNYLIPANTKRGRLIFGMFKQFDLILLGIGILITIFFLAFLEIKGMFMLILAMMPGLICGFLVIPIPNYHNILNVIIDAYTFLTSRQTYKWKGWCYKNGKKN